MSQTHHPGAAPAAARVNHVPIPAPIQAAGLPWWRNLATGATKLGELPQQAGEAYSDAPLYRVTKSTPWSVATSLLARTWSVHPRETLLFAGTTALSSLSGIGHVFLVSPMVAALQQRDIPQLLLCAGGYVALWSISHLIRLHAKHITKEFNEKTWGVLLYDFQKRMSTRAPSTLADERFAATSTKVTENFSRVAAFTQRSIEGACQLVSFAVVGVGLATQGPHAAVVCAGLAFLYLAKSRQHSQRLDEAAEELAVDRRIYLKVRETALKIAGLRELMTLGKDRVGRVILADVDGKHIRQQVALEREHANDNLMPSALDLVMKGGMLSTSLLLWYAGTMGPEQVIATVLILNSLQGQMQWLVQLLGQQELDYPVARSALEIDTLGIPDRDPATSYHRLDLSQAPKVVLTDVTRVIATGNGDKTILAGVSMTLEPGRFYGVVGPSGAGKTTLIRMLLRQELPTSGKILINENDLATVDPDDWRAMVSFSCQNPHEFSGYRVSTFMGLGDKGRPLSAEEALTAFKAAAVDFVDHDSLIGDNLGPDSRRFSGGEQARLHVARLLLPSRARLVIADEPTAALDAQRQHQVMEGLRAVMNAGATVLVVTHRYPDLQRADGIFFMDGGKVVESGTHEELMRLDGRYAEMFRAEIEKYSHGA